MSLSLFRWFNLWGGYCTRLPQKSTACEHRATGSLHVTASVCARRRVNTFSHRPGVEQSYPVCPQMRGCDAHDAEHCESGGVLLATPVFIQLWFEINQLHLFFIVYVLFSCVLFTAEISADWSDGTCRVYFSCLVLNCTTVDPPPSYPSPHLLHLSALAHSPSSPSILLASFLSELNSVSSSLMQSLHDISLANFFNNGGNE